MALSPTPARRALRRFRLDPDISESSQRPQSLYLEEGDGEAIIGRGASCDLRLDSQRISRRHGRLAWEGNVLKLYDLGSRNGLFVNGKQVGPGGRRLAQDDLISFSAFGTVQELDYLVHVREDVVYRSVNSRVSTPPSSSSLPPLSPSVLSDEGRRPKRRRSPSPDSPVENLPEIGRASPMSVEHEPAAKDSATPELVPVPDMMTDGRNGDDQEDDESLQVVLDPCSLCQDWLNTACCLTCGHMFCQPCIVKWLCRSRTCPLCKAPVRQFPMRLHQIDSAVESAVRSRAKSSQLAKDWLETQQAARQERQDEEAAYSKLLQTIKEAKEQNSHFLNIAQKWSSEKRTHFRKGVVKYPGKPYREKYCELVGFTPAFILSARPEHLEVAMANLKVSPRDIDPDAKSFPLPADKVRLYLLEMLEFVALWGV